MDIMDFMYDEEYDKDIETNKLKFEKEFLSFGHKYICGIDEVGRGALFGPVLAGAVIMPLSYIIGGVDDSKKLSSTKRENLYNDIVSKSISYSVFAVEASIIDKINIYNATKIAMMNAVKSLKVKPDLLLIDAMKLNIGIKEYSIIKGDSKSYSIACASILAKVTRDRMMVELSKKYPYYHIDKNKGYGSKEHLLAIEEHGPSDMHRYTFAPIKDKTDEKNAKYKRELF